MDKYLAPILDGISNESIGEPKILLGIFLIIIVQIDIEVLKILTTLGVLFGGDVEHVGDAELQKMLGLEAGDKVAVEKLGLDLDWVKALKQAVADAPAEGRVREAVAVQLLFVLSVGFCG